MMKWKWMLGARVPSKLFIVNENGDHFWVDYSNWRIIKHFILFRAGLSGADAVNTIGRLLLSPFTVIFLLVLRGLDSLPPRCTTVFPAPLNGCDAMSHPRHILCYTKYLT